MLTLTLSLNPSQTIGLYCSLLSPYNAEPALREMSVENVIRQNSQRHT